MGKISPVSIKYIIYAKFNADGPVEKPDVIGAIFGQTEGLLGDELELRELQKNGKIGRIEVEINTKESKSEGMIQIPTSLDKTETTIIAAAIETIDRVGPCTAKVEINKIDDVRGSKREYVLGRAKALLEKMSEASPDSREMHLTVSSSARASKVAEYGPEKLPVGPDIENNELIVVEGRADVVNLLKYNIKNVIGMDGASLPKTISELGKERQLTIFVDGDRGGDLILKDAMENARIEYVARAPPGREVEELTGKEILSALRAKVPASEYVAMQRRPAASRYERHDSREMRYGGRDPRYGGGRFGGRDRGYGRRDRFGREDAGRGYGRFDRENIGAGYSGRENHERYGGREEERPHGREGEEKHENYSEVRKENETITKESRESMTRELDHNPKLEVQRNAEEQEEAIKAEAPKMSSEGERSKLQETLSSVEGSKAAVLLDEELNIIKKVSGRDLPSALSRMRRKVYAIVLDGNVTGAMLNAADKVGVKRFAAKNFSATESEAVELISL